MNTVLRYFTFMSTGLCLLSCGQAQSLSQADAKAALHKVVEFYRTQVGYEGAYLYRYAVDGSGQEGEEVATRTSGWVQPPGTPSVGEAYLKAWFHSGEQVCLDAALEVADALIRGQLKSGGWSSHFELGEEGRKKYAYRTDGDKAGKNNNTTFDDNKTQSALMFLMHLDEALDFKQAPLHEAVEYSLKSVLAAQYPNGAWPQQFAEPGKASTDHHVPASFPESWSRTFPKKNYVGYYTLNDGNMSHIVTMLLEANRIYNREDCLQAALKTGDFFLLAQLPDPQPGWAQQYDTNMHPAWARKFEPPAVTGGESQAVMKSLITLYRYTGDKRFVATIPKALAYYRKSLLPNGSLARFYELQTNKPLYFTKEYELTYSSDNVPTHYSFEVGSALDSIERDLNDALNSLPEARQPKVTQLSRQKNSSKLRARAARVLETLDNRGAWVESGRMSHTETSIPIIETRTFIRNLDPLAQYVGATE